MDEETVLFSDQCCAACNRLFAHAWNVDHPHGEVYIRAARAHVKSTESILFSNKELLIFYRCGSSRMEFTSYTCAQVSVLVKMYHSCFDVPSPNIVSLMVITFWLTITDVKWKWRMRMERLRVFAWTSERLPLYAIRLKSFFFCFWSFWSVTLLVITFTFVIWTVKLDLLSNGDNWDLLTEVLHIWANVVVPVITSNQHYR